MRSPVADLLADLGAAFTGAGVPWYLFGAQAAILHGSPRLTADVDVTVDIGEQAPNSLIETLAREGFSSRVTDPVAFLDRTRVLPLVHVASGIAVDVVLAGPGLEETFFARVEPLGTVVAPSGPTSQRVFHAFKLDGRRSPIAPLGPCR